MYSMYLLSLLLLTTSIVLVSSGSGKCPTNPKMAITVWPVFVGTWYEYASYGDGITRTFYKCMKYTFTSTEDTVDAVREYILKLFHIRGSSYYSIAPDKFSNFKMIGSGLTSGITMWLVDADYDKYAILWSCENHLFGAYHTESSWIITRNRTETLDKDTETTIKNVLKNHSMDLSWYGSVSQSGCD